MIYTKYRSQGIIEPFLNHLFPRPGYFLEIGAWDGKLISQTYWLEKVRQWTGLCVDPFPIHFEGRICDVCDRAVSADGMPREFVKVFRDRRYNGDVSYFSGFRDSIAEHWPLISEFCDYEIVQVPTITIDQLYENYIMPDYIEFLSLDTEGSELEIIQSIDFSKYHYRLIMFEHNRDEEKKCKIGGILETNGYRHFHTTAIDDLYISQVP